MLCLARNIEIGNLHPQSSPELVTVAKQLLIQVSGTILIIYVVYRAARTAIHFFLRHIY